MGCVHYRYCATFQTSESDRILAPSALVPCWFFTWNLLFTASAGKNQLPNSIIIGTQSILKWKLNLSYQFRCYVTDVEYCCASIRNFKHPPAGSLLRPEELWSDFGTVGRAARCTAFGVVWSCVRFPLHKEAKIIVSTSQFCFAFYYSEILNLHKNTQNKAMNPISCHQAPRTIQLWPTRFQPYPA